MPLPAPEREPPTFTVMVLSPAAAASGPGGTADAASGTETR